MTGTGRAIRRLGPDDVAEMRDLNGLFAEVFDDRASYAEHPPSDEALREALARAATIVLVAVEGDRMIGGLVAYELRKLEQARSEVYLYDLAVRETHRRRGVATALIGALRPIAAAMGAWAMFVQADHGDDAAVALYDKLGVREDVMHFDLPVGR